MTKERLMEILTAYGADPSRWPENERADAQAFIVANPEVASASFAEAKLIDQLLDTEKKNVASTDLLAHRILKSAQEFDMRESPANDMAGGPAQLPRKQPMWRSIAATFVITTGVGFAMGQAAAAKSNRLAEAEALLSLTLDSPYESANMWEDL